MLRQTKRTPIGVLFVWLSKEERFELERRRRGLGAQAPPGADEASATREKTRSTQSEPRRAHADDYVFEWEEEMQRISIPFPSPSPPRKSP